MTKLLKETKLFAGLLPQELEQIEKLCEARRIEKGTRLFETGQPADYLFVVVEGEIALQFDLVYSNRLIEIPVESKRPGEAFGWSALIEPYRYTLSALAAKDCELLQVRGREIKRLCEENTHLGYVVLNNLAQLIGKRFLAMEQALVEAIHRSLKEKGPSPGGVPFD